MTRSAAGRRRVLHEAEWEDESTASTSLIDDAERRLERLDAENARLRDSLEEVEGWYRLLQADHATLQRRHDQVGRKAAGLQAESDRRELKYRELEAPEPARTAWMAPAAGHRPFQKDDTTMNRIKAALRSAARYKWASAALLALATLLARDPGVQAVFSSALARARNLGEARRGDESASSDSGYVLYAAMSQAREDSDKARLTYNQRESALKGDELLEAQDRLRATKARYRQARLAFLPALIRECRKADLPVPKEAMEAFASLKAESVE